MAVVAQTKFSHKLFEPTLTINEAKTHCVAIFDKLKFQREQGRFCDVILKVYDRDFPAHRCVLASCSPWFDTKFKVHKTLKEVIEIENCKNYEVFHLVLTYMYSGEVVINKDNVADILAISHMYSINKLKSYCAEFLEKNLKVSNCVNAIELAEKYHLIDFSKQTLAYINKHFEAIIHYHEIEKKQFVDMQQFINKSWGLPNQLVLRLITRWVEQNQDREEHFQDLLNNLSWSSIDPTFIESHLDNEKLYKSSEEALLTILTVMEKNNVELSSKYRAISQEKLLYETGLQQELDDSNDLLFKDLENSDVYESISSFMQNMQNDSIGNEGAYGAPYRHPSGNDMEVFKTESEVISNSQEMTSGKKSIKRSTACSREEDNSLIKCEQEVIRSENKMNIDQSCALLQDPRVYLGDMRGNENPVSSAGQLGLQGIPHSADEMTSPPDGEEANLTHSNVDIKSQGQTITSYGNQENCVMFKTFPSSQNQVATSGGVMQTTEACYRQAQQYSNKGQQQQYSNSDLRYSMVDHVDGELFKQSHDMYRDDLRGGGGGVGGAGYSQLGFLPPGTTEQMLFQDHLVFSREQMNPNLSRDGCVPHSSFIENYKHILTTEQQNMMVSNRIGVQDDYTSSYNKDANDPSRNVITSSSDSHKADRLERMNSNRSNFDNIDYSQLVDILCERPPGGQGMDHIVSDQRLADRQAGVPGMDQVIPDQRLADRSTTTKRYDPKFRALAEASKHVDPDPAMFGYKSNEADVACDNLAVPDVGGDYKSHFMYKIPSQQDASSSYRNHNAGYKQTDFIMGKSELDCYRYGEIGNNFKTHHDLAGYEKDLVDVANRSQAIPRSTEVEMFKTRPMINNEYLQCADMQKDNIGFGNMTADAYHNQSQSCSELRNIEKQERTMQLSDCAAENSQMHSHAMSETNVNKRMSGAVNKQNENSWKGEDLDLVDHQELPQEFKNCRISERNMDRHGVVNSSVITSIPSSVHNMDYNMQQGKHDIQSVDERNWMESRKNSGWDQGSATRNMLPTTRPQDVNRAHLNKTHNAGGLNNTDPSEDFLAHRLEFGVNKGQYDNVDGGLVSEEDQNKMHQHQRKNRLTIAKESPILDHMQIDCQFVEDMRPISYDPIPMSCDTPHYSRDTGSIIEPFRNSEILEPSLLDLHDMNSFPTDMKKAILETPPRKDIESPSRRRQKTVPPPLILTPKEKYAKEIHAERKLDNIMKNVFSDQNLENNLDTNKRRPSMIDKPNETTESLISDLEKQTDILTKDDLNITGDNIEATMEGKSNDASGNGSGVMTPEPCESQEASSPRSTTDLSDICSEEQKHELASQHQIKIQNNILKILRHKKKLASQKKLILEHGGVKLTHKQKIKLKQRKKKPASKTINKPVSVPEAMTNTVKESSAKVKSDSAMKKIVNLKDKLLAEHRSQSVFNPTLDNVEGESKNQCNIIIKRPPCTVPPDNSTTTQSNPIGKEQKIESRSFEISLPCQSINPSSDNIGSRNERSSCQVNEKNLELNFSCPSGDKRMELSLPGAPTPVKTINLNDLQSQTNLKCLYCDVVSNERKDFFKHLKEEHLRVAPFKCPKCGQEYNKISLLLKHHKTHTSRYECTTCHLVLNSHADLRNHAKIHKGVPSYVCDICSKSFSTKNNLEQHKAVHSDEKKFKCSCGFSTKFSSHLAEHKRTHEGKVHRCTLEGCQYWTAKKTLLNAHMRMHNGEKKFVCKVCSKGFVEAGQLRRHEKIHTNDKKFVCDVENCSYSSTRKDKLKEHKNRIHNREPTPPPERKQKMSKLSSLNKYHIPSVQSDFSETIDEDDPAVLDTNTGGANVADGNGGQQQMGGGEEEGMNKYYSVESGVHLSESQIPYVKEEYILGM